MVFSQTELRTLGQKPISRTFSMVNESLLRASSAKTPYVFLSHSSLDSDMAKGFVNKARDLGITVYFDLYDSTLQLPPSGDTAEKLRARIKHSSHFILLATRNSVASSRWCPWELGCADGFCIPISIAQTKDENGQNWGAEYLQLYHSIEIGIDSSFNQRRMARMRPRTMNESTSQFNNWCNSLIL